MFGESGEVVKHGIGDASSERADREEEAVTMRGHFVVDAEWPETCEVRSFAKEFGVGNADGVGEAETVNMLEVFVLCGSDKRYKHLVKLYFVGSHNNQPSDYIMLLADSKSKSTVFRNRFDSFKITI